MKIRFVTKDNITEIKECPEIDQDQFDRMTFVMSPMWKTPPSADFHKTPTMFEQHFLNYRKYQFTGDYVDHIPTVHEV